MIYNKTWSRDTRSTGLALEWKCRRGEPHFASPFTNQTLFSLSNACIFHPSASTVGQQRHRNCACPWRRHSYDLGTTSHLVRCIRFLEIKWAMVHCIQVQPVFEVAMGKQSILFVCTTPKRLSMKAWQTPFLIRYSETRPDQSIRRPVVLLLYEDLPWPFCLSETYTFLANEPVYFTSQMRCNDSCANIAQARAPSCVGS